MKRWIIRITIVLACGIVLLGHLFHYSPFYTVDNTYYNTGVCVNAHVYTVGRHSQEMVLTFENGGKYYVSDNQLTVFDRDGFYQNIENTMTICYSNRQSKHFNDAYSLVSISDDENVYLSFRQSQTTVIITWGIMFLIYFLFAVYVILRWYLKDRHIL